MKITSKLEGECLIKTVVVEKGFRMISLGNISKFWVLEHLLMALISLSVGFSNKTLCCENLPNSVFNIGNLTTAYSSLHKLSSYHFSPKCSFTNAILPLALPIYKGL